jgi:hypothetical protein
LIGAFMEASELMNDIDAVLSDKPISPSLEMAAYEALVGASKDDVQGGGGDISSCDQGRRRNHLRTDSPSKA